MRLRWRVAMAGPARSRPSCRKAKMAKGDSKLSHVLTLASLTKEVSRPTIRATALVFEDPASRELKERLNRIAHSTANVLIVGETGTGKELVARFIHDASP